MRKMISELNLVIIFGWWGGGWKPWGVAVPHAGCSKVLSRQLTGPGSESAWAFPL